MGNSSRKFGQYEIIRRLGVGGMAETFEARRYLGGMEQRVCLKRVLPAFSQDAKFNEQFLKEARMAASLRHSNIVSVLDFGAVHGSEYLVLELIDGLDLRALLSAVDTHRLDAELVSLIALDLAYALSYTHSTREGGLEGIVHRDISPANVLISVRGEVKLADFGIAKAMSNAEATASGTMKGKIAYMAPEQMRGHQVDGRTDLFALGVTLYEALAGERPFQGTHDVEVMTRLLAGEHRPLADVAPGNPASLVRTIETLLEREPVDRLQTAEAFVDALAECAPAPTARRRLACLVQQLGGLSAPRPGHDLTDMGPLDTELGAMPEAAPLVVPAKTNFKSNASAAPGVVKAAQRAPVAQRAAAAMGAGVGGVVSKSTVPARPNAIASSAANIPVPKGTMPASPKATASSAANIPVPKGTMPASPKAIASTPPPSMEVGKSTQRAKPTSTSTPAPTPASPTEAARAESGAEGSNAQAKPLARVPLRLEPRPSAQGGEPRRLEPPSDEVVLPMRSVRPASIAAVVGLVLLVGSGVAIGLRWSSGPEVASNGTSATVTANAQAAPSESAALARTGSESEGVQSPTDPETVATQDHTSGAGVAPGEPSTARPWATPTAPADPQTVQGAAPAAAPDPPTADGTDATEYVMQPNPDTNFGTARVRVRADPWGSVWVDGRYIGRSPAIVVLPVGAHVLGGGVGHIMGTKAIRVTTRAHQQFVVHVDYP